MSKPDMEQLEADVSTLIEVCRRLKDENEKLTLQMEGLIQKGESLANEKEFIKDKLELLSELEMKNKNNYMEFLIIKIWQIFEVFLKSIKLSTNILILKSGFLPLMRKVLQLLLVYDRCPYLHHLWYISNQ